MYLSPKAMYPRIAVGREIKASARIAFSQPRHFALFQAYRNIVSALMKHCFNQTETVFQPY